MDAFILGAVVAYGIIRIYLQAQQIQAIEDLTEAIDDFEDRKVRSVHPCERRAAAE
jgi:hypothetical protein